MAFELKRSRTSNLRKKQIVLPKPSIRDSLDFLCVRSSWERVGFGYGLIKGIFISLLMIQSGIAFYAFFFMPCTVTLIESSLLLSEDVHH